MRLLGRSAEVVAYAAVAAILLGIAASYTVARSGWVRRTVQRIAAQELANYLGRTVRVGSISGDLWRGVTVNGIEIDGPDGVPEILVEQVQIKWDLGAVVRRKAPLPAAIRRIRLVRPYLRVVRDSSGQLNVLQLVPRPAKPKKKPRLPQVSAVIEIVDGAVDYDLVLPELGGRRERGRLRAINATADLTRRGLATVSASLSAGCPYFNRISLQLAVRPAAKTVAGQASVKGLRLPRLAAIAAAAGHRLPVRVVSGVADATLSVWLPGPGRQPRWTLRAQAGDISVRLQRPAVRLRAAQAYVAATAGGATVAIPLLRWPGGRCSLDASLWDYTHPAASVHLADVEINLAKTFGLLPPDLQAKIRRAIAQIPRAAWATGEVTVAGPLKHPTIWAAVRTDQPLSATVSDITVGVEGLKGSVVLHDPASPAAVAELAADGARISGLPELTMADRRIAPRLDGIGDLHATVSFAGGRLRAYAPVSVEKVGGLPVDVGSARGELYLAGHVAQLRHLRAKAAGGTVAADVAVDLAAKRMAAQAEVAELDVSAAQPLLPEGFNHTIGGRVSGLASASITDAGLRASACVTVTGPTVGDVSANLLAAQISTDGHNVRLPWAIADAPEGRVALSGQLRGDRIEANVAVSDVDVSAAGARAGLKGLAGRAWAVGQVTGTLNQPHYRLRASVLEPGYADQCLEAAYIEASGTTAEVAVSRLMAASDGAVLSARLTATELSAHKPYARLEGTFALRGARLSRLLARAKVQFHGRLLGQLEVEGAVRGTVTDPAVTGLVRVAGVSYDIYRLERLTAPVSYRGGTLIVGPAHGSAMGVELTAHARATGLLSGGPLRAAASLATGDIDLSRVVILHRYGVGLDGLARVRRAEVVVEDRKLLSASADIGLRGVILGDDRIPAFSLVVDTKGDRIRLRPAAVRLAGGVCRFSGQYATSDGSLKASAELAGCRLDRLMASLAAGMPRRTDGEKRAAQQFASLALRLAARVSGTVVVRGKASSPTADVNVRAASVTLDQRRLPDVRLACRYDVTARRVEDIALEAQWGQGLVLAHGFADLGGQLNVLVDASGLDLSRMRQWLPSGHSTAGVLQFTCQISGRTRSPVVRGSFDVTDVNIEGIRFDLVSVPVFDVAEGAIAFDTLILKRGDHEMNASGRLPFTWDGPRIPTDKPISLKASLARVDLETLFSIADEYMHARKPEAPSSVWGRIEATGFLDATADISGTLQRPRMSGAVKVTGASIRMTSWAAPIEDISVDVSMEPSDGGSRINVAGVMARYQAVRLRLAGKIGLRHASLARALDNDWFLEFSADADGQRLPGGTVINKAALTARFASTGPGAARVEFVRGSARVGGGRVAVTGGVDVTTLAPSELQKNAYKIAVAVDDARVIYRPYVTGLVNGSVVVKNPRPGEDAAVVGKLRLSHAILGADVTKPGPGGELRAAPASVPPFKLDVTVAVAEDVEFRGVGVRATVEPNPAAAVISGTPHKPRLAGGVSILRGQASMPGGLLTIERFDLRYSLAPAPTSYEIPRRLEIRVQVRGRATRVVSQVFVNDRLVGPVRIHLTVEGELPGQLRVHATSEPPLAEEQIYAILGAVPLGGFTPAAGGSTQALSQRFVSLMAMGLRAGVFEPLEMRLRQLLGLAEFSISFELAQPVEVRLGKYIARNLLVSYRHQLGAPGQEHWWLAVSYEVMPGTVVTYYTRDDGETRFSVGVRRTL